VRSFILILLVGGPGLITGVTYFLVVAMLIKLVRLLRRIQPTRREPGRFFIALRGGPLAPATIGWRTVPVRISLTDQPGEFCDWILSSVGSEIVVSHRTCSDSVFRPSLTHTR
jgi:hypothetical protein